MPLSISSSPQGLSRSSRHAAIGSLRPFDAHRYKVRNLVERFFCRLKQFRRIVTRYDKLALRFNAFLQLACVYIWLL